MKLGDVVLVHDQLKRNYWRIAVVEELYEGRDGFVRGCKVRTITKTGKVSHLDRPVNKLYPLEIQSTDIENVDQATIPPINEPNGINSDNEIRPMLVNGRPRRAAAEAGIQRRRELDHE